MALSHRNAVYNKQLDLVEQLEDEGKIIVIRPRRPIEVGRIENDTRKLTSLYDEGYSEAASILSLTSSE